MLQQRLPRGCRVIQGRGAVVVNSLNRADRNQLALLLRRYVAGRITNDELADAPARSQDPAIQPIYGFAWRLYDDVSNHELKDDTLSRLKLVVWWPAGSTSFTQTSSTAGHGFPSYRSTTGH